MAIIDGKALLAARQKKAWTQAELSEATKIDISTISRIERAKPTRVRGRTLKVLASALGVVPDSLCRTSEVERDTMKMDLTYVARNALTLVARRYGIEPEEIVEMAPLLFFVAAEQSLQERRGRIAELRASADVLARLQSEVPHLPLKNMGIDEDKVGWEEISINENDIFGGVSDGDEPDGYDREKQNPFVMFLRDKLAKVSNWSFLAEKIEWDPELRPNYWVCLEEAAAIVGGDEEALRAILVGEAALHKMPEGSPEEKAAWVRGEAERLTAEINRLFETMVAAHQTRDGTS